MAEEPSLPAPPAAEPEEAGERLMGAMGGGVASSVVHLPLLSLPMWGRELAVLADPAGSASSLAELVWSRALVEAPTVPHELVRLVLHVSHAAMSMTAGLVAGALLRWLLPGRRSARAGAVAAFFYGIHPLHRPMFEHAGNFPVALAVCALGFAVFKSIEAITDPDRHRDDLELLGVCGLIGGLCAPFAGLLAGGTLVLLARSAPAGRHRRMAILGAVTAMAGAAVAVALAPRSELDVGLPGGSVGLRFAEGFAGLCGAPPESARRLLSGAPVAGAVLFAAGAVLHGLLLAMIAASSAFPIRRGKLGAALAGVVAVLWGAAMLGEDSRLAATALAGVGFACLAALGFASHVRAKSLLFVLALAGSLFASEVERVSPYPAVLERARVAGRQQAIVRNIGREHQTRKGVPMGEGEIVAGDGEMVGDLGSLRGIAMLLGEPGMKLAVTGNPSGALHVLRLTRTGAELACPAGE